MIQFGQRRAIQEGVTALVIAAYLLVLAMAASPALHHWLHDSADEADHQCAAVTLAHGQLDRPSVDIAVVASWAPSWFQADPAIYAITIGPLFLLVSVLEHAPPISG